MVTVAQPRHRSPIPSRRTTKKTRRGSSRMLFFLISQTKTAVVRRLCSSLQAKLDEILRREKEREQRANSQTTGHLRCDKTFHRDGVNQRALHLLRRGNVSHKSDSLMSLSTDAFLTRRAISAPRIRPKLISAFSRLVHAVVTRISSFD